MRTCFDLKAYSNRLNYVTGRPCQVLSDCTLVRAGHREGAMGINTTYYMLYSGATGLSVSLLLYAVIQRRWRVLVTGPREAQFHHHSASGLIPRLGGICIVGGFTAACLMAGFLHGFEPFVSKKFWAIVGSALAMFAVGIFDDFKPIGAKKKLLAQLSIASLAYFLGMHADQFKNPLTGEIFSIGFWGYPLTVLWLVAMTNLINLIDGIDGLAGGIGIMLMGLLAWVAIPIENGFYSMICVGVIGALLGFLRFNFPPAKIYMGDGGAYFLGFLVGLISLETSHKGTVAAALTAPALALALPILDTTMALLRRGMKGLPLFRPDMEHIHHKLLKSGVTRLKAVLTLYVFCVIALCTALTLFLLSGLQIPIFIGLTSVFLIVLLRYLKVIPKFSTLVTVMQSYTKLRWHSRYMLTLSSWLQMEAEQCETLNDLWTAYAFFPKRVGFSRVRVIVGGEEKCWDCQTITGPLWQRRHHFSAGRKMLIEFSCSEGQMTRHEFEHVTDLAAEAWLKAVNRWEKAMARTGMEKTTQEKLKGDNAPLIDGREAIRS